MLTGTLGPAQDLLKPMLQSSKPFTPLKKTRQNPLTTVQLPGRSDLSEDAMMTAEVGSAVRDIVSARGPPPVSPLRTPLLLAISSHYLRL